MKRLVLTAILLAATAGTASAGGFVGLGIGTEAGAGDGFDGDGRSGRLELGYSFGRFSVEGLAGRYDLRATDTYRFSDTTIGIAGVYRLPLSDGFGVYGRLGLQHSSVTLGSEAPPGTDPDYSGSGILLGGGADFKLPVAVANLSLFVDYTIANSGLRRVGGSDDAPSMSLTTRVWTLGAKLGF